jgi:hypothetical protein
MAKILAVYILLAFGCFFVNAQDQFTNTGDVHVFSTSSITFFGNFVNDGIFTDEGGVSFNGTVSQAIAGTSITTFYNLTGNNAAGVTMQQSAIVSNGLILTNGPLILNSTMLTINNSASTAVSRTSGYILSETTDNSSKLRWNIGANTSAHAFPFGTASGVYIPLTLTNTAGNIGNVTISTYTTAANNTPYPTSPVAVTDMNRNGADNSANVVDRFWQIDKDGVSGTATVRFEVSAAEAGTITQLRAQRWNSTTNVWEAPIAGQTSTATSATVSGVTSFSPWTLSGNNAPLPVELLTFTAKVNDDDNVDLYWETASEINNDYFAILRSEDGNTFYEIARVDGTGNSQSIVRYRSVDIDPLVGRSYYRLKQTDFDGVYKLSDIRTVEVDGKLKLIASPNPVTDNAFTLDFHSRLESPTFISLYDRTGKIIYSHIVQPGVSKHEVNLSANPTTGVYLLRAVNGQATFQQTVMIE